MIYVLAAITAPLLALAIVHGAHRLDLWSRARVAAKQARAERLALMRRIGLTMHTTTTPALRQLDAAAARLTVMFRQLNETSPPTHRRD